MVNPIMPRNIQFRVETMFSRTKNRIGRIIPDELGVYSGIPLMVLGEVTQQGTFYDPASMIQQMVDPNTHFNMVFQQQKKKGEYGHPTFYGLNNTEQLTRLRTVDESRVSHLFTEIYTDKPVGNTVVVRANLKPTGPFGSVFKEELDDPVVNTAFSLRAYVDTEVRGNVRFRRVRQLVTWDTVGASGYATTDKANAIGLEDFSGNNYNEYEINVMDNGNLVIDQIALETFTDTDLNEIFGTREISKIVQSRTLVKADRDMLERFPNMYKNALFNDFFKE